MIPGIDYPIDPGWVTLFQVLSLLVATVVVTNTALDWRERTIRKDIIARHERQMAQDRVDHERRMAEIRLAMGAQQPMPQQNHLNHLNQFLQGAYDTAGATVAAKVAEQDTARSRARQLLLDALTDEQRATFEKSGHLNVTVAGGKRTYRIRTGKSMNVDLLDKAGHVKRTFCAYPTEGVPDFDAMLAQKLMLETDEGEFLSVANAGAARAEAQPAVWPQEPIRIRDPGALGGGYYAPDDPRLAMNQATAFAEWVRGLQQP